MCPGSIGEVLLGKLRGGCGAGRQPICFEDGGYGPDTKPGCEPGTKAADLGWRVHGAVGIPGHTVVVNAHLVSNLVVGAGRCFLGGVPPHVLSLKAAPCGDLLEVALFANAAEAFGHLFVERELGLT